MAGRTGKEPPSARLRRIHKALHRARTLLRRSAVDYFRGHGSDWVVLVTLLLSVPALAWATLTAPLWAAPEALVLPLIVGGLLLRPISLLAVYAAAAGALVVESVLLGPYADGAGRVTPGTVLVVSAVGFVGLLIAQFRTRVGVPWTGGGTMLFDLRERLRVQSQLPSLPKGWHREMSLRPAGGQSFSGDFVVAARTGPERRTLEVVLTDVSGKGMDAGSRALLLSGAFGGLLGSLPPHAFLPAANAYLLRQDWEEGFATSIHLVLDLDSGDYELFSAGHPPALQLSAGSGRWEEKSAGGPLLGVYDGVEFHPVKGRLRAGDVLMLFTDGLVETSERDLADGIDRLTGAAETYVATGFRGAAWHLIEKVAKDVNDDRALVLISRS
ncbi:PP2C family protein-serine/threonine phosphatase [Streptomyces alkaliterrae]|uniref:Serine/threonine-protein phosphatase n=1 Tax=Streptomyces alkaliterrae TaxID=2213162 RepID=A0A5P0YNX4_9ACTN|nr:PP2C family protein-serine/threonine phosphatase [Streptomyces alkaliterrae]MBB1255479.1 serine/threonine-protein phosphatase [Streptomyces alkaliterrae]MBB1261311.1 serine/threonine-protein phosphatase [Streptomyces alkaliterrae]MQS01971.1 SpoIIE family protein phosphatase [Streptomyces alkaliterrae]